jgi:hypothetical protein
MKSAQLLLRLSALLLLISLSALIVRANAEWASGFPFMFGMQLAVILVFAAAMTRLRKMPSGAMPLMRAIFPPWLIVAAAVGLIAIGHHVMVASNETTLKSLSGAPVTSTQWRHSIEDGRYYARVNQEPEREISKSEYDAVQRETFPIFACFWVGFSVAALFMWNLVVERLKATEAASDTAVAGEFGAMQSPRTPAQADLTATASTGSSTVIAGIWCAAVLLSLVHLTRLVDPQICNAPFPPLVIILMPFVVFGFGAFRAKYSPFYLPWIAQIVDAKYGERTYERFLVRLKPLLMFGVSSIASAVTAAAKCGQSADNWSGLMTMPIFFLSTGLAFMMMHFVMRYRKVLGV